MIQIIPRSRYPQVRQGILDRPRPLNGALGRPRRPTAPRRPAAHRRRPPRRRAAGCVAAGARAAAPGRRPGGPIGAHRTAGAGGPRCLRTPAGATRPLRHFPAHVACGSLPAQPARPGHGLRAASAAGSLCRRRRASCAESAESAASLAGLLPAAVRGTAQLRAGRSGPARDGPADRHPARRQLGMLASGPSSAPSWSYSRQSLPWLCAAWRRGGAAASRARERRGCGTSSSRATFARAAGSTGIAQAGNGDCEAAPEDEQTVCWHDIMMPWGWLRCTVGQTELIGRCGRSLILWADLTLGSGLAPAVAAHRSWRRRRHRRLALPVCALASNGHSRCALSTLGVAESS